MRWVVDASSSREFLCFCPLDDGGRIVWGLSYYSDEPPGQLVGVWHPEGSGKAQEWREQNKERWPVSDLPVYILLS